jgi:hypothetical protein
MLEFINNYVFFFLRIKKKIKIFIISRIRYNVPYEIIMRFLESIALLYVESLSLSRMSIKILKMLRKQC